MLKLAICDDDIGFVAHALGLIDRWPQRPQDMAVSSFTDGDALLRAHAASPFDIILLDMVMPLMDGIETAREIRATDPAVSIIYLTSSSEFAVESYTVRAYHYLLKPVDQAALYGCLDRLSAELLQKNVHHLLVRTTSGTHRVDLSKVECVEAQNKHTLFTLAGGCTLESIDPLHDFETQLLLGDGFFRCHRSYIINIYHIASYTAKEAVTLSGCRVPIARSNIKDFEEAYFDLLFGKAGG